METAPPLPFLGLLLLGAVHGLNPAMGWLFAVARGMQEQSPVAVWGTLLPLALGHALAIAAVVGGAILVGLVVPLYSLRWLVAATLAVFGVYRLFRHGHPSTGGMTAGMGELTLWSFLMASAHGAGLMVLPLLLGEDGPAGQSVGPTVSHAHPLAANLAGTPAGAGGVGPNLGAEPFAVLATVLTHTLGYLLVAGLVAAIVYHKLGLRLLRTAWINIDRIWAMALIGTAGLTLLL